eukprot:TRINITY_DN14699_c0_g2_i3.p1 TRINITY_DN14699_c0_g2~~TRINITY_DN14699_c0_g2_i3.p1  ORF type:complete len:365 (+),score=77.27 TRINITY_DN14699_c0_g2_i3:77-1171(+)
MLQYISSFGNHQIQVLNGNGLGGRLDRHVEQLEPVEGGERGKLLLDNSRGVLYKWQDQHWKQVGCTGILLHGNRTPESVNHISCPEASQLRACKVETKAIKEAVYFTHPAFSEVPFRSFLLPAVRSWDLIKHRVGDAKVLAVSTRGPELVEWHSVLLGCMFHLTSQYPDTLAILTGFVTHQYSLLRNTSSHQKLQLFHQMCISSFLFDLSQKFAPLPEDPPAEERPRAEPEPGISMTAARFARKMLLRPQPPPKLTTFPQERRPKRRLVCTGVRQPTIMYSSWQSWQSRQAMPIRSDPYLSPDDRARIEEKASQERFLAGAFRAEDSGRSWEPLQNYTHRCKFVDPKLLVRESDPTKWVGRSFR